MAANDVFMDTAGFLALWDASDAHLLVVRHSHAAAADFLKSATASESLQLHWITPDRFHAAAAFFARHDEKEWSFTDCVSFGLMHELNVRDSFTTDQHFRQAGFNPLLGTGRI